MDNKAKLSFYIEELSSEPIAIIDAEVGKKICHYVKYSNIESTNETKSLKEKLEKYVINWFLIENGEQVFLKTNDDEDDNHIVQKEGIKLYGELVKPYSYHTFLFPFLWKDDSNVKTRKEFARCLDSNLKPEKDFESNERFNEKYNQYHYFNPAARNAIYSNNDKDSIVWNYKYNLSELNTLPNFKKDEDNTFEYVIQIGENEIYKLAINAIRLKLFNTGIGILIFELENHNYPTAIDITKINKHGRRIYMPFSSGDTRTCDQCAEDLYLTYNGESIFDRHPNGIQKIQESESFSTTRLAAFIMHLFTGKADNDTFTVTTNKEKKNKNTFYIEPVIDDRMYVACYCLDNKTATEMQVWENGNYAYLNDITNKKLEPKKRDIETNIASQIYKYVYIDDSDLTCQSKNMFKQALSSKYVYDRWIEYGSLTGITAYSMVTITNSPLPHLASAFLTEYVEMAILALAQRASLLNFERMLSDSALNKSDIREIHKEYLLFQSQLLLKEVTPQQQGIELYRMLLDNLFISEQVAEIENQIEDAFAQKTADNESRENTILFFLAIFSIFEAIENLVSWVTDVTGFKEFLLSIIKFLFSESDISWPNGLLLSFIKFFLSGFLAFLCVRYVKNKKNK